MRYKSEGEVHKDFHGLTCATLHYLVDNYGREAMIIKCDATWTDLRFDGVIASESYQDVLWRMNAVGSLVPMRVSGTSGPRMCLCGTSRPEMDMVEYAV